MNPSTPLTLTNADLFAAVVGFLLPLVISTIATTEWDKRLQAITAFIAVLIASTGTVFFSGQFDVTDWVRTALIVFTMTITSHYGFMKPIGIDGWMKANFINTPKAEVVVDSVNRASATQLEPPHPIDRHYVETDSGVVIEVERKPKHD